MGGYSMMSNNMQKYVEVIVAQKRSIGDFLSGFEKQLNN